MASKVPITVTVNGNRREAEVEARLLLVHFLRESLGLTGTHVGCDTSNCSACAVLMDGKVVKSCTVLAVQADGRDILTVEGLATGGGLHPVQEAFIAKHGLQCGFCTPRRTGTRQRTRSGREYRGTSAGARVTRR